MLLATRSYRWKIYPNKAQQAMLAQMLVTAAQLYNHALAYRKREWQRSRRSIKYAQQNKMLTAWRNESGDNPLALLPSSAAQRTLRRLDKAYREFLRGKRGYPRFKASKRWRSLEFTYGNGATVRGEKLRVHNVGEIKVRWYRPIPDGKPKALTILRKPSGWYMIIQMQVEIEPRSAKGPAVGIDVGLKHALALSDGTLIDSPKYLRASLRKLRVEQRALSRKKRGGKNRDKQRRRVARLHERIQGQRKLWWHTVTRRLVETYSLIAIEDLRLSFMARNRHLSQVAHDIGLGMLGPLLDYKAMEAGVEVVRVDPRNTSQVCSGCGCIVSKELNERRHRCPDCGLELDRDVNAARNILLRAQLRPVGHNVSGCAVRAP